MVKICLTIIALCLLAGAVIGLFASINTPKTICVVSPVRFIQEGTIVSADMLKYESISEEFADCAYTDNKGLVGGTARYSMSPDTNVRHCPVYNNDDVVVSDELRYVYTRSSDNGRRPK
ncbi:MAG: hypothetical protein K2X93_13660 [Candidatus Obscuribacterales bacterium]|nr:hypothetical protein [Candidatus Obscuribacterales bacterium]